MSDRLKMPPEHDFGFYQRRKHDKWRAVPAPEPALEGLVADSHAHVHMLPDPAWELARCAANGVGFVCEICDPSEDDLDLPADLRRWAQDARAYLQSPPQPLPQSAPRRSLAEDDFGLPADQHRLEEAHANPAEAAGAASASPLEPPMLRMAAGVHPHNAKLYDNAVEAKLLSWLDAPETVILGEIGLDYHYDLSPRDVQRAVFRRQIQLAKDLGLPVALHLRGGADPQADDAHREAFEILSEEGFPARGAIVHCCALPPDALTPWIEADCYIAYGGALTFKNADEARAGAQLVPEQRLLLETDSPYMAPEPMRGAACTPAHIVFTAAHLADLRGCAPGPARERLLAQLWENTCRFFTRP